MMSNIKKFVKDRYGKLARDSESERKSCCSSTWYTPQELESIPEDAIMGLGCGNPVALADLNIGDVVLDLGAGAGIDVFLAANKVGETGYVIGVDMTEEMVSRAKKIADRYGYRNVEFRLGEIEHLPIEDHSIDVIISNCVINLSPDKLQVYKEAYRVLKPGGRLLVSDMVTECELPDHIRKSVEFWTECIGGALLKNEYIETIKRAGFTNVKIISEHTFTENGMNPELVGKITSIYVKAYKP
jgi:SAM-dependent methyltransferase